MKVTPSKDFHYALDGIRPTLYKKGVEVDIPEQVVGKLQEAGGYLVGFDKKEEEVNSSPEGSNDEPVIELLDIKGMKKNFLPVLKTIGVENGAQLKEKSIEELAALDGISEKIATQLLKLEVN
jgi:hypothetical protein